MTAPTTPAFSAVPLDDAFGLPGFYSVQHDATGSPVARWDGTPARWQTKDAADSDAQRIASRQRPLQCQDIIADSNYWRP